MIGLLFMFVIGWLGVFNITFNINTDCLLAVTLLECFVEFMIVLHRIMFKS